MTGRSVDDRRRQLVVVVVAVALLAIAVGFELRDRRTPDSAFVLLDDAPIEPTPNDSAVDRPATAAPSTTENATVATSDEDVPTDTPCSVPAVIDGEITAPATATRQLAITEVHYHPAEGPEFIEITNVGSSPVDLGGWSIGGVGHCWRDAEVVPVGGRVVVTEDAFNSRLSNGGDRLALFDSAGVAVDVVEFDDRQMWPADADGGGASLHRIDGQAPGGNPGNWISSPPAPGVPTPHRYGVLPTWTNVEHTILPVADASVTVTARLVGVRAAQAELAYRVGFGAERVVPIDLASDGSFSASIPGQSAGSLIRYRLIATSPDGATGTWPRQGDGATYTGTTVATGDHELQRIEWFMEPAEYRDAFDDISLSNDRTYPAVFAVDGVVFDSARIRVKGRSSLGFPKPKWKVDLPAGHRLAIPGLIDRPVDEFALHAAYNDKSFLREVLAHDAFATAGLPVTDAFPVRLHLNGEFDGLYIYVEQADGRWRSRVGLDDATVYDVGVEAGALLDPVELDEGALPFELRYDREEGRTDDELRALIEDLASITSDDVDPAVRRAWFGERVDIPSILNTLAASAVIQHQDFRSKNYRLALVDGRWSMIPYDLELTWGRGFDAGCFSVCDVVEIDDVFVVANTNLTRPFVDDPVLSRMLSQRIATLRDVLLDLDGLRSTVDAFVALTGEAAQLDRDRWGTHGAPQSPGVAAPEIIDAFAEPQFERLSGPDAPLQISTLGPNLPPSSVAELLQITRSASGWSVTNTSSDVVDASGLDLGDGQVVPPGVVVPAGGGVVLDNGGGIIDWLF